MILHCHHYNTFLQNSIEDANGYFNAREILVNTATEVVYSHLVTLADEWNIQGGTHRKQLAEQLFSFAGFGQIRLDNLNETGGEISTPNEHFAVGWKSKFGQRPPNEPGVSFFAAGFLAAAAAFAYDKPMGSYGCRQTACLTTGDDACRFLVSILDAPLELEPSPAAGVIAPENEIHQPDGTRVDYAAIREALISMPIAGSETDGLIDAFGVLLTRMYANYYCLISNRFVIGMQEHLDEPGLQLAEELLVEAGHVCGFNTLGGIMLSDEWEAMISPMIDNREDWLHGIVACMNALGWGHFIIQELIPSEKLVLEVRNGYESNSHLARFPDFKRKSSYLMTGGTAALMNLLYNGDITQRPELSEEFYNFAFKSGNRFVGRQIQSRVLGDQTDVFEAVSI